MKWNTGFNIEQQAGTLNNESRSKLTTRVDHNPVSTLPEMNSTTWLNTNGQDVVLYTICSVMALTILVGAIGNLMVVLAVKTSKKLQTTSNVFVVNLSVCDLLFVTLVLPFNIYTYIVNGWFYNIQLCKFIGFLGYTLTGTTIITITMISWNRYQLVVNQHNYKQIFSHRKVVAMLLSTWILPVLSLTPAIFEVWGQFGYVPMLVACNLFLNHESQSFKLFLLIVRAGLPCGIIIYHYARIFLITRASHRRILSKMPQTQAATYDIHKQKKELHLTRMMTVIFGVFILSYFPCTITGIIDWNTVLSRSFHMICAATVYVGSAVNPLIYGLMNRQFRQAYCKLLSCGTSTTAQKLCLNTDDPSRGRHRSRRISLPASLTVIHHATPRGSIFKTIVNSPLLQSTVSDDEISVGSSDDPFVYREETDEKETETCRSERSNTIATSTYYTDRRHCFTLPTMSV